MTKKISEIGLKLKSTEIQLCDSAKELFQSGLYQYVELYVVPSSYEATISYWISLNIPFVIHAPHTADNVNIADFRLRKANLKCYTEVKKFADALTSLTIIVHPGCNGTIEEVVEQLLLINDDRLCIENKPVQGLNGQICRGSSPEEIQTILNGSTLDGFVLDFGHAICAAKSYRIDPMILIREFMKLKPVLFHLADGERSSEKDVHHRFGEGNLDLKKLVFTIPTNARVTIETPRNSKIDLQEFVQDVAYLKNTLLL